MITDLLVTGLSVPCDFMGQVERYIWDWGMINICDPEGWQECVWCVFFQMCGMPDLCRCKVVYDYLILGRTGTENQLCG